MGQSCSLKCSQHAATDPQDGEIYSVQQRSKMFTQISLRLKRKVSPTDEKPKKNEKKKNNKKNAVETKEHEEAEEVPDREEALEKEEEDYLAHYPYLHCSCVCEREICLILKDREPMLNLVLTGDGPANRSVPDTFAFLQTLKEEESLETKEGEEGEDVPDIKEPPEIEEEEEEHKDAEVEPDNQELFEEEEKVETEEHKEVKEVSEREEASKKKKKTKWLMKKSDNEEGLRKKKSRNKVS